MTVRPVTPKPEPLAFAMVVLPRRVKRGMKFVSSTRKLSHLPTSAVSSFVLSLKFAYDTNVPYDTDGDEMSLTISGPHTRM